MKPAPPPNGCTGLEQAHLQRRDIEASLHLRVRGEQDLEAPIEEEAVHGIGPHPAADPVRRLEHRARHAGPSQVLRAREPGHARANDQDLAHEHPSGGRRRVASPSSRLSAIRQTAR